MAEKSIAGNANYFSIDKYTPHTWICRDDDGDFWTIVEETDNDLAIYKSENNGDNWVLKKTLTNSDFTGNPFPLDDWQIVNLENDDAVYITLRKGTSLYGWEINTLTDVGAKDLDNDVPTSVIDKPMYVRWDVLNSKLYVLYSNTSTKASYMEIVRDGTLSDFNQGSSTGLNTLMDSSIDSSGNKYSLFENTSGAKIGLLDWTNNTMKQYSVTLANIKFANLACKYNNDIVMGWYDSSESNEIQIRVLDGGNISSELLDTEYNLDTVPLGMFITVDGNDNIYVVYTDGTDKEAYYLKYDGSWSSPTKISSDFDGELLMPELRAPLSDNSILVTYSATL